MNESDIVMTSRPYGRLHLMTFMEEVGRGVVSIDTTLGAPGWKGTDYLGWWSKPERGESVELFLLINEDDGDEKEKEKPTNGYG